MIAIFVQYHFVVLFHVPLTATIACLPLLYYIAQLARIYCIIELFNWMWQADCRKSQQIDYFGHFPYLWRVEIEFQIEKGKSLKYHDIIFVKSEIKCFKSS